MYMILQRKKKPNKFNFIESTLTGKTLDLKFIPINSVICIPITKYNLHSQLTIHFPDFPIGWYEVCHYVSESVIQCTNTIFQCKFTLNL